MPVFTVINHTELGATTASWSATSIAASYDHLLLKASIRGTRSSTNEELVITLNSDTTAANYSATRLRALSATPSSTRSSTGDYAGWDKPQIPAASATANTFGILQIWIPNYANTANFKQALMRTCQENASTTDNAWYLELGAGLYHSTSAIDAVSVTTKNSGLGGLAQYSTFTLYGVTGA
jgi:hypothetical protein